MTESALDKALNVCGEAYQIIGALAYYTGKSDHPDVVRAMDRLCDPLGSTDEKILPWPKADDWRKAGWQRIETAPKDGTRIIIWALAGDDHPIAQAHFASWEDWGGQNGHLAGAGIWRGHTPSRD